LPSETSDSAKTAPTASFEDGAMASPLTTIPNVGPAVARTLERLGIAVPDDLRGRDPVELFERLCELDGRAPDPCLLDTFVAAVSFVDGGPPRPWWELSRERKARQRADGHAVPGRGRTVSRRSP
jgi:hypothetical protein